MGQKKDHKTAYWENKVVYPIFDSVLLLFGCCEMKEPYSGIHPKEVHERQVVKMQQENNLNK